MLKQLFLRVAIRKICFSAFRAVLGNILTLELPYRSGYPASWRVFMYLGIYLTLNEAKIAEAGITHSVLFWLLFHLLTFISFKSLWKCQTARSFSQQATSQTWNRILNPVLVFLNMAYFRAHFTARCAENRALPFLFIGDCTWFHVPSDLFVLSWLLCFALRSSPRFFPSLTPDTLTR